MADLKKPETSDRPARLVSRGRRWQHNAGEHAPKDGNESLRECVAAHVRAWLDSGHLQQELADALGVAKSFVSEIVNEHSNIGLPLAVKLADALGVRLDLLVHPPQPKRERWSGSFSGRKGSGWQP